MHQSLIARVEALEAAANAGRRTHIIWDHGGTDIAAEIARKIAAGHAKSSDRFFSAAWRTGPEVPMNQDIDPFGGPAPAPPNPEPWSPGG